MAFNLSTYVDKFAFLKSSRLLSADIPLSKDTFEDTNFLFFRYHTFKYNQSMTIKKSSELEMGYGNAHSRKVGNLKRGYNLTGFLYQYRYKL